MDARSGRRLRTFEGHPSGINALAYAPDGTRLASGGRDHTVRVWDVRTGKQLFFFAEHQGQIRSLAYSADGKKLASNCGKGELIVWDLDSGKPVHRVHSPKERVYGLAFSPDGKVLAAGCTGGLIRLYEVAGWKERVPLKGQSPHVSPAAFFEGGAKLLTVGSDRTLRVWEIASGKEIRHFGGAPNAFSSMAISPDGKTVTGGFPAGVLVVWDIATGKELRRIHQGSIAFVGSVAYSPDSRVLAAANMYMVRLWDPATGEQLNTTKESKGQVTCLAFSPDGQVLAVAGDPDDYLRLHDVRTGKVVRRLKGVTDRWSALAFSPDGKVLAGAEGYKTAPRLWETTGWKELPSLPKQGHWVRDMTFLAGGKELAFVSSPDLLLYDLGTGKERLRLGGRQQSVLTVAASRGVKSLATGDNGGGVSLWDQATGKLLRRMAGERQWYEVSFSSDGKSLAVSENRGLKDEEVVLWETATGATRLRLRGQSKAKISPTGREIATVDVGGKFHVWDAFSGRELASPQGHVVRVSCLAFSLDGKMLATGSPDTTVLVWDLNRIAKRPARNRPPLSPKELSGLWEALANADAAQAYRALGDLVEAGDEVEPFLKTALGNGATPDAAKIRRLIVDLDSFRFAAREKASEELSRLGRRSVSAMQKALSENPTPEVARRLESLLGKISKSGTDLTLVHFLRAVEVLERRATVPSRQILRSLAEGDPEDLLCVEVRASLDRLGERPGGR
jgi:WD40 repeat protein